MNGSHILVNTLLELGVDTVFGYPGGSVLNIYDAMYDYQDRIKNIITSTEQGAAHAADGYARSTGKVGVALATSGPGATNLITGIATAFMDSVPVVYITGNVAQNLIGKDSFQEVYTTGITMPITKHNFVVREVGKIADTIREAFRIADSGRKGPVLVDFPKDVTIAECDYEVKKAETKIKKEFDDEKLLEEIADLINKSKKPVIYSGGGVIASNAYQELRDLIEKSCIPACNSIMGIGNLDYNRYFLGMVGMHGRVSTNYAIDNSDLIIAIGTRFSDRTVTNTDKFAPRAKIIHIDIDASEIRKNVDIDYYVIGDVKDILAKLLPKIQKQERDKWLGEIENWKKLDYLQGSSPNSINPKELFEKLSDMVGDDAILVTDVGQHQMWACQYCKVTKPRQFLTSAGLGTMGYGYGAAIGAKIANPEKTVVHITGDGSFHMNLNEVATAVRYDVKIITVILNNGNLGMVKQLQHYLHNKRYAYSNFERSTDYVKLADSFGADGYRCYNMLQFEESFANAIKNYKSAIIECKISGDEQVLPMIPANGTIDDLIVSH
ncbi:MAG: biosynthetic-type acetolactate synthase large subunit [Peptoanaerobacter stomatis]